ncbi:hypothetical protein CICLE_v10006388mg [Citrus x clementina]|uniref:Uncharacterized protein n=1 Tax=Citrus clementina TaxID=85681 RepID=V4RLF2_CITCL|nr:hypothetical protein CICLE_v10006388mg [Citrus x clementina]
MVIPKMRFFYLHSLYYENVCDLLLIRASNNVMDIEAGPEGPLRIHHHKFSSSKYQHQQVTKKYHRSLC